MGSMPITGQSPRPSANLATESESALKPSNGITRGSIDDLAFQALRAKENETNGEASLSQSHTVTAETGRRDFVSLLNELMEEHQRCLQEAASGLAREAVRRDTAEQGKSVTLNKDIACLFFESGEEEEASYGSDDKEGEALYKPEITSYTYLDGKEDVAQDEVRQEKVLAETVPITEQLKKNDQLGVVEKITKEHDDFQRQSSGSSGSLQHGKAFHGLIPQASPKSVQSFDTQLSLLSSTSAATKSCQSTSSSCSELQTMQQVPPCGVDPWKGSIFSSSDQMNYTASMSSGMPDGYWAQVVASGWFDLGIACLIIINTGIMAAEIQYLGLQGGYTVEYPRFDQQARRIWPNVKHFFVISERTFTVIFSVELSLRLAVFRLKFFRTCLNWIDVVTVAIGWLDWLYNEAAVVNPTVARLMRLAKLSRSFRLAKLTGVLSSLHLLSKCVTGSFVTLSWSVCILLAAQCISGMMLSQLVYEYIMDESKDLVGRQEVFAYYGTFTRSLITMFEVHLANFGPACRVLLDNVGEEYAYIFLAYRCLAGFAIINVINAVFVQQTISVAQEDQEVILNQKNKEANAYSRTIRKFLERIDTDGDGLLTEDQLVSFEDDPTYNLWMSTMDIGDADLRGLFRMIDVNKEGRITVDEFILGAARIKGPAKSVDMVQVLAHLNQINRKVQALAKSSCFDTDSDRWSRQSSPAPILRRDSFHHGM